jgi:acetylornithine deacetylase
MDTTAIEKSELWELSQKLIGFDTVSAHSDTPAAEFLANYLDSIGFTTQVLKEQLDGVEKASVLAWAGPPVEDGLIISGHIDVVPFEGQPGWKSDPLKMHLDDDRIYGRGVTDMKVFLAQSLLATKHLGIQALKKPLVFIFTCDEEVAGQGSKRLIDKLPDHLKDFPLPKLALIGEPTNLDIYAANKGYATFDILLHGQGGHSSVPPKGLNAIEQMADVIGLIRESNQHLQQDVSEQNRRLFPEFPFSAFNCGTINGGLAPNMIADACRLTVSLRVTPGDDENGIISDLQQKVAQKARQMQEHFPSSSIAFENIIAVAPMQSPESGLFCDLLTRVYGKRMEQGAAFATDGGNFQQIGIHSYICGPGALSQAHQPNEYISLDNFNKGTNYIEQVVRGWCI